MKIAYFDCFNGAAGDMIVGALIDAGADAEKLRTGLEGLGLTGYTLNVAATRKQGFAATRFEVKLDPHVAQPHRHLADILELLRRADLPLAVRDRAAEVFTRLGQAEAKVHGTGIEKVHFHEVGAVDALLDVVGAVLGLELLGIERVNCSPIPVGSGVLQCAHGTLPVPAPATAELLAGVPLARSDEEGELTTPTGAALLTTLADEFGPLPALRLSATGCGAGQRESKTRPNLLRVLIGETDSSDNVDEVTVLETNLDDTSPEIVGHCLEQLISQGALDAYAVPIHMKKSRTGVGLTVLCNPADAGKFEQLLFAETTTFGIRRHQVSRVKLQRRFVSVNTPYGVIRMKMGTRAGGEKAAPEFEDCRSAALAYGVAVQQVMLAAQLAGARQADAGDDSPPATS